MKKTLVNTIKNAVVDFKEGFDKGYVNSFNKVTNDKYDYEGAEFMGITKTAIEDLKTKIRNEYTLNVDKFLDRTYVVMGVLYVLAIADIIHVGWKEHFKKAYTYHPVGQFLLSCIGELILVLSCIEKKEEDIEE